MVSDEPRSDRCGFKVVDKTGLVFEHDELDMVYRSDDRLESIELVDADEDRSDIPDDRSNRVSEGESSVTIDPEYEDLRDHLHTGWNLSAINLSPSDASQYGGDGGDIEVDVDDAVSVTDGTEFSLEEDRVSFDDDRSLVHVEIESDAYPDDMTNLDHEHVGYCECYPNRDSNRCRHHNRGGKKGNTNPMTHGLTAKRSNYYKSLGEDEKDEVEALFTSWLEDAPFDRDSWAKSNELFRIAIDQYRLVKAQGEFVGGLTEIEEIPTESGEIIEKESEKRANLAYDRLDRTTTRKLKDMGILDPDDSDDEAQVSITQIFESSE